MRELDQALLEAAGEGNLQAVQGCLVQGADPNATDGDFSVLYWAALAGSTDVVRALLAAGARAAEAPAPEGTALHAAARKGHAGVLALLLTASARTILDQFDDLAFTPLMWAVQADHLESVKVLLAAGADVNAQDYERAGNSALRYAAAVGSAEVVELLLQAGADPHQPGWMGLTPIDMAEQRNDAAGKRVRELLAAAE